VLDETLDDLSRKLFDFRKKPPGELMATQRADESAPG
jgi:hypothetical protein